MTNQRGGVPSSSSSAATASNSTPVTAPALSPTAVASPGKPELPWAFIDCPHDTLVVLIAHMLELLCQHNDQVLLTPDALTRFHSRASPGITIVDYLRRIVKYTNLEKIPLLSLLAYIDLTCQNLPTFTLSSLTVHRFLIAGVTAGSKAQCDVFCTNAHYAKVGGIKVGELNSLEREFLRVTGWALCCHADLLQRYYTSLIRSHGGFTQASEPEVSPFMAFPHAGEAPDSIPVTPADSAKDEHEANGSELGSVEEGDEDEDEDEDEEVIEEPPVPEVPMARGRPRQRDDDGNAMDVDPTDKARRSSETKHAGDTTKQSHGHGLKSLVGGLFGRRDRSQDPGHGAGQAHDRPHPISAPAPVSAAYSATASTTATPAIPRASSGNGHSVRSRPVASPALGPGPDTSPAKQLTPRVRTRDERSVESLRGVGMPPAVAVDDCKRRAMGD